MKVRTFAVAILGVVALLAGSANAQTYPARPLRLIVPFPPGGAADITGRVLAEHMSRGLGQPVVVENKPGGSTIIGSEIVARAPADGYTLLVVFPSFIVNPSLRPQMPFSPLKDFRAVGQTIAVPMAIAVNPSIPARSLADVIALAKAKPGELSYGTPGIGTTHHIMGEMLKLAAKINLSHAPFSGAAPALTAVAGNHVSMIYGNATEIAASAKGGKVRAVVTTGPERADVMPDVPTMRESGFPELEATNWAGMVVAAATPPAIVARLNAELVRALRSADVQEKFKAYGITPMPSTAAQFDEFLQSESARYTRVVREAGIKAD